MIRSVLAYDNTASQLKRRSTLDISRTSFGYSVNSNSDFKFVLIADSESSSGN